MIDCDTMGRFEHAGCPLTGGLKIVLARHAGEENAIAPKSP
jgi:hypothetical protein